MTDRIAQVRSVTLPGPYVLPAYRSVGHVRLTNKTPCGTYRMGLFPSLFYNPGPPGLWSLYEVVRRSEGLRRADKRESSDCPPEPRSRCRRGASQKPAPGS